MTQWPHDDTASKNAFYGDFRSPGWQDLHLAHIFPPFKMYYAKQYLPHGILVHRLIGPALQAAFGEIWNKCNQDQSQVDAIGASDWGCCFDIRPIAGSDNYSNHSWACAVDLWPERNGFNAPNPGFTEGSIVVKAFDDQGFLWGGRYSGRKDFMHFEAVSR